MILLYDNYCDLCNFLVRLMNEKNTGHIRFLPLQSGIGEEILRQSGLPEHYNDSVVFTDGGKTYIKSSAVLHMFREMGGFRSLLFVFIIIPSRVRDLIYDLVARYRYIITGKNSCKLPLNDEL